MSLASHRAELTAPNWPTRLDLEGLSYRTPLLAISRPTLASLIEGLLERHRRASLNWTPLFPAGAPSLLLDELRRAGVPSGCCSDLATAQSYVSAGGKNLTLIYPPMGGTGPQQLARLAASARITVVVDHFAQAEQISHAVASVRETAQLLLRVDAGRKRIGVRPGPDLIDLARGVARLPAVHLSGVFGESRKILSSGLSRLDAAQITRLLKHCQRQISTVQADASRISLGHLRDFSPLPTDANTFESRTSVPLGSERGISVVAGVMARPTRDQAVVDIGHRLLGRAPKLAGFLQNGAAVAAVEKDFLVLRLGGAAQDLAIGDLVPFQVTSVFLAERREAVALWDDGWQIREASRLNGLTNEPA